MADVDRIIANKRVFNLGRAAELDLLRSTFADPVEAEACEPRAEAIMDAAGVR